MDIYRVVEVLYGDRVSWESQDYRSAREAKLVQRTKQKRNQNPSVTYRVKRIETQGTKTVEKYI